MRMHGGLLALVVLSSHVASGVGMFHLRASSQQQMMLRQDPVANMSTALATLDHAQEPVFEILEETIPVAKASEDCICPLGKFWHWRLTQCVDQGPWGYECGFFPEEHHHRVCMDGLKCQPLKGVEDNYFSHGIHHGKAGSYPASCVHCQAKDNCLVGEERHKQDCLVQYKIEGDACVTVQVSLPIGEYTATATASHTAEIKDSAEATAKADATATHTATAKSDDGKHSATATATKTASAEATQSHEATSKKTVEKTVTETITHAPVGKGDACVTPEEGYELMGIGKEGKMGAVLAEKTIAKMQDEAFERASEYALKNAMEAGMNIAKDAAEKLAMEKAKAAAKLEAEQLAREDAAWVAESGANNKASGEAAKQAKAKAEAAAKAAAEKAAKAAAEAKAAEAAAKAAEAAAKAAADAAAKEGASAEAKKKAEEAAAAAAKAEADAKAAEEAAAAAEAAAAKAKADADAAKAAEAAAAAKKPKPAPAAQPAAAAPAAEPAPAAEEPAGNGFDAAQAIVDVVTGNQGKGKSEMVKNEDPETPRPRKMTEADVAATLP